MRRLLIAVAVGLVFAPAASADPVAQILRADGTVIASAGPGRFDFPRTTGSLLHIGSASVTARGVELEDVSLLGGRIQAVRVLVPPKAKRARIEGLYVDGRVVRPRVNRLVPLTASDYLITSQAAVGPKRRIGVVGLRLSFGQPAFGLPAGTQFLVGLPARPQAARPVVRIVHKSSDPLVVLGFGGLASLATFHPSDPMPGGTIGQRAVAIAKQYLGIPYVYAGADPITGFDCSGLTMYVYEKLGIHLQHWTGYQIHEGTPIPRWALQPGDLVFFYDEGGVPGHEGIYIGNNQFLHAPHTGDVVKISTIDSHYSAVYVGAVRPY
ncbi:MAG: C40 family peptidase [Actinobacteria bacterium]|nr:C40 family peptidase [Actinomycetota bacterium]